MSNTTTNSFSCVSDPNFNTENLPNCGIDVFDIVVIIMSILLVIGFTCCACILKLQIRRLNGREMGRKYESVIL